MLAFRPAAGSAVAFAAVRGDSQQEFAKSPRPVKNLDSIHGTDS